MLGPSYHPCFPLPASSLFQAKGPGLSPRALVSSMTFRGGSKKLRLDAGDHAAVGSRLHDEHDAAVRLGARLILLGTLHDLAIFTHAHRAEFDGRQTSRRQVARNRLGALLRQGLVVGAGARRISVTLDRDDRAAVVLANDLRETI